MSQGTLKPSITFERVNRENVQEALDIYKANPTYFSLFGDHPSMESLERDLKAMPNGIIIENKHYCFIKKAGKVIGLVDLIVSYPEEKSIYIGLYMMKHHRKGLGKEALKEIERQAVHQGYQTMQLGILTKNLSALNFWKQNGFQKVRIKSTEVKGKMHEVIEMKKSI